MYKKLYEGVNERSQDKWKGGKGKEKERKIVTKYYQILRKYYYTTYNTNVQHLYTPKHLVASKTNT